MSLNFMVLGDTGLILLNYPFSRRGFYVLKSSMKNKIYSHGKHKIPYQQGGISFEMKVSAFDRQFAYWDQTSTFCDMGI